ncbi:hypothetical protein [Cognatilysobacter lacus]|uniref:Uncharacterized protein n=1 Tax=Cognatilysobacter lacus TaxID=1643323 RepID=A0A5D8Z3T6_9GAMM|nr:hypothetical protein [Lysobacter lacus]TZF87364.1 hypothetical protein FW784_11260 [Lysobacter lacus]
MEFSSWLHDSKVRGINVAVDIEIGTYWDVCRDVIDENEFQRRRVSVKGKPYQLLQRDLIEGCVMPPVILALKQEASARISNLLRQPIADGNKLAIEAAIARAFADRELLILDGLQRTFTIGDCITQLSADPGALAEFRARKMRLEVYLGLNKMGILYRMLTLNTGQTPMSFRHQIEMLYGDYLDHQTLPNGITVVREVDNSRARGSRKYKFADVVDMFYAFSTGKPESMDKQTLVGKLAELDFLDEFKTGDDDLQALLVLFDAFIRRVEALSGDWVFDPIRLATQMPDRVVERPFGRNVAAIFERVQPMSAFGAECKRLIRQGQFATIADIGAVLPQLQFSREPDSSLDTLVLLLDEIARKASKIGTAQREVFQYSFRALLNQDSDDFADLSACWVSGQEKFESLN